jgi:hypothetical protein
MKTDSVKTRGLPLTSLMFVLKNSVRTSRINTFTTITKFNRLMLLKEMFP